MNLENKKDDKLDLISLILGIASLVSYIGLVFDTFIPTIWGLPIAGLVLGIMCKKKTKKRTIGIILNSIVLILQIAFIIIFLVSMYLYG